MQKKCKGCLYILNEKGLHARPSTELVKCAGRFKAKVQLTHQNTTVNGKSLLGILMLAANKGAKITVEAVGEDAEPAVNALIELASNRFNIKY